MIVTLGGLGVLLPRVSVATMIQFVSSVSLMTAGIQVDRPAKRS